MSRAAGAWPRGGLWRHREFLLLWSAQGISAVGSRITRTALPIAAILLAGAGAIDLGLLTVALTLPGAVFAWIGGGCVDRHKRRPLMIGADLVRAVMLLSIPAAALYGTVTLPLLCAVAVVTGLATVLHQLADHVFVTDLVGRERVLDANGKREAADAVAEISGPALASAARCPAPAHDRIIRSRSIWEPPCQHLKRSPRRCATSQPASPVPPMCSRSPRGRYRSRNRAKS